MSVCSCVLFKMPPRVCAARAYLMLYSASSRAGLLRPSLVFQLKKSGDAMESVCFSHAEHVEVCHQLISSPALMKGSTVNVGRVDLRGAEAHGSDGVGTLILMCIHIPH